MATRRQLPQSLPAAEAAVVVAAEPYHTKYRPRAFKDVIGQKDTVQSLVAALRAKSRPHAFIFTGPSGTGKTTLARILMQEVGCLPHNIIEADAATNNGIDAMRTLTEGLRYQGFGAVPNKGIIIDEAHAISKQAWQSLLKSVEEPPAHVFWCFCTTEPGKIPDAIITRCHAYNLKPVRYDDVFDLLDHVVREEDLGTPEKFLGMVARACNGSPRQALVMLSMVQDCEEEEEVATLLAAPLENKEVIDLCRQLVKGDLAWAKVVATLKALDGMPAESIRIVVVNYLASCLMGARSDKDVARLLDLLAPFSKPFASSDKLAPLLLAFGDLILGG